MSANETGPRIPEAPILRISGLNDKTLAASIVGDYVRNNTMSPGDVPKFLREIHETLRGIESDGDRIGAGARDGAARASAASTREHKAPDEIARSITPDAIVSFLDGRPYMTLRRHLKSHKLTPEQYFARFGLPGDYPLTAPNYAAKRREMALAQGLGGNRPAGALESAPARGQKAGAAKAAAPTPETAPAAPPPQAAAAKERPRVRREKRSFLPAGNRAKRRNLTQTNA